MFARRRPRGAAFTGASAGIAVLTGFALSVASSTLALGAPTARLDYPTWADVQAAKANQAATQAEVTKLQGLLATLQQQADATGRAAEQKAEQYNQANLALADATAKTAKLQSQAEAAKTKAEKSSRRASALISQLARTGSGDTSLGLFFGSGAQTDQLLSSLGTASRLSESSEGILRQAEFDKNAAGSLSAAASAAQTKRGELAAAAKTANEAAQKADADAQAQLAQQTAASTVMYAQLASLKNTTAATEQQYQAGLAEEARQNAVKKAPSAPIINPNPPLPVADAVAGAIAFARAQLGKPYQFGGAGPDSWDCSGLTMRSYQSVGVYIGAHLVSSQYNTMKSEGRLVNLSQLLPGDLLFYADGGGFYHVALAIGGNQMIEAPRPGVAVRIATIRYGDLLPYVGRPTG